MASKRKRFKDAKAEKLEKKRKARKRKRAFVLILEVLIFCGLLSIGYLMENYDKIKSKSFDSDSIFVNDGVSQDGYMTIALFGGDSREGQLEEGTHADTIILVSVNTNTKEIKMVSVYRDTPLEQMDGTIAKANSAYFTGGPQEAINMLNKNLDLHITDYVTVDFKAMVNIVDLLGGIEIDVTAAEAAELNNYIEETARVAGTEAVPVSEGTQILDGAQAVTYARIRKNVGGDYARTERQRVVIQKIAEKVKTADLSTITDIINQVVEQISTSFELNELLSLAKDIGNYKIGESSGFPFEKTDGSIEGLGSVVIPLGMKENVEELHAFLYPGVDYTSSDVVNNISNAIETLTGYGRQDYSSANNGEAEDRAE